MRVLVTGGAGYIGSVLVPTLLEHGHEVTVLDTFERGTTELAACCRYPGFDPIRGDARDETILDEIVPRVDVLIPLAALVGAPLCKQDPITAKSLNRDAVLALVRGRGRQAGGVFICDRATEQRLDDLARRRGGPERQQACAVARVRDSLPIRLEDARAVGRSGDGDRAAVVQRRAGRGAPGAAPARLVWRILDRPR